MNRFLERGGLWVVGQFVLMIGIAVGAVAFRHDWDHAWSIVGGNVLMLVGVAFGIAGLRALGRNTTPFPRPRENARLVRAGIYGLVRHPLYTSLVLTSFGWTLHWQSRLALVLSLTLAALLDAKANREERWLLAKFPAYVAYRQRVRKLIPWLY